jgi:sortase A
MRQRYHQRHFAGLLCGGLLLLVAGCSTPTQAAEPPPLPAAVVVAAPPTTAGFLPDRLAIPAIHLDTPVVELGWSAAKNQDGQIFSEWDVAQFAAGWHKNSARLNEPGNVVLSAHNNVLGAVFRELDQLRRNDTLAIWAGQRRFDYVIQDVIIVPEKYASVEQQRANAQWIGDFGDTRLTLVSCWPRDDNTHRIIVVAFPAPPNRAKAVG